VQESAWVQLRQAAHHWTTVVTLLNGDPVGVIPLGRTLQDAFNDARVLKNDIRHSRVPLNEKPFLCHSGFLIHPYSLLSKSDGNWPRSIFFNVVTLMRVMRSSLTQKIASCLNCLPRLMPSFSEQLMPHPGS